MQEQILISKEDFADFLSSFEEKISVKRQELEALEERYDSYKKSFNGASVPKTNDSGGVYYKSLDILPKLNTQYNSLWVWSRKIDYFLEQGPKSTTDIVEAVLIEEPDKRDERAKIVGTVSAILSAKAKPGPGCKYIKSVNERNVAVYELKKPS